MNSIDLFRSQRQNIKEHIAKPMENRDSRMYISDREISGYAIVWGSVNDFQEAVLQGATLKSLNARGVNSTAGNKIQLLLQHDKQKILGNITELREDDYGLFFRATISEGIQYCEEALIQVREGVLKQLSYGFNYVWTKEATKYDEEREIFVLSEIILHEISLVTFSSDPAAQLRSYGFEQMMLRLSRFSQEDISTFIKALEISSTADEATNESVIESITSKFN